MEKLALILVASSAIVVVGSLVTLLFLLVRMRAFSVTSLNYSNKNMLPTETSERLDNEP